MIDIFKKYSLSKSSRKQKQRKSSFVFTKGKFSRVEESSKI